LVGAGNFIGRRCLKAGLEFNEAVELLAPPTTSWTVPKGPAAVTGWWEFCNGYRSLGTKTLGVWTTGKDGSAFRMGPLGMTSVKIGVGGNSTTGGGDTKGNGREQALDANETGDPNRAVCFVCCVELVLLVPFCCRRRSTMCAINSSSKGFLGA